MLTKSACQQVAGTRANNIFINRLAFPAQKAANREFNSKMQSLLNSNWWCCEKDPDTTEYKQRPRMFATPRPLTCPAASEE